MDETIKWEYVENNLSKPPMKSHLYLVKGYVIDKGRSVRVARLVIWNGSSFNPSCDDMVIERYAQIIV